MCVYLIAITYIALIGQNSEMKSKFKVLFVTHTHPFNGPLSGTTQVSRYQKGKTNLDFTEARDSGWQWHQLGYMQVCTSLQTDNHTSSPPLSCFLQAGCPSCRPTNSVKALKALFVTLEKFVQDVFRIDWPTNIAVSSDAMV